MKICPDCNGTGIEIVVRYNTNNEPYTDMETCKTCYGADEIDIDEKGD